MATPVVQEVPSWYDPGVTEQNVIPETPIVEPAVAGVAPVVPIQKAGFIRMFRFYLKEIINQSAATGAPSKSVYGTLGSRLQRISILAAGRKPFLGVSGLGLEVLSEVENPYGSVFAAPTYDNTLGLVGAKAVTEYTAPGTGAQTYNVRHAVEYPMSLPVWLTNVIKRGDLKIPAMTLEDVGLWYLQERKTQMTVESSWYAPVNAAAASNTAAYSGGTGLVATLDPSSRMFIERDLFTVPQDMRAFPNQTYVHVVNEYEPSIAAKMCNYPIAQVGALLRAIGIMLDSSGNPIEWDDLQQLTWSFGTSDTPINRAGYFLTDEFVHDNGRYPPKGVVVLDFWKAGNYASKLARNTDQVANLSLNALFGSTTTGTIKWLLESLVPEAIAPAQ